MTYLVVANLLVATSLVSFGPRIGRTVGSYLVCQFGHAENCDEQLKSLPQRQPDGGRDPRAVGETMPVMVQLDVGNGDGVAEECTIAHALIDKQFPGGQWNTAMFAASVGATAAPYGFERDDLPDLPSGSGTLSVSNHCQLEIRAPSELSDGPDGGAHAEIDWASWAKFLAAVAIGVASGLLVWSLCYYAVASLPILAPIAPYCPALGSFFISAMWTWAAIFFGKKKGEQMDGTDWLKVATAGIVGAFLGYAGKEAQVIEKIEENIVHWIESIPGAFAKARDKVWGWVKPYVDKAGNWLGPKMTALAEWLKEHGIFPRPEPEWLPQRRTQGS